MPKSKEPESMTLVDLVDKLENLAEEATRRATCCHGSSRAYRDAARLLREFITHRLRQAAPLMFP